jgi:hypothetical protein
MQPTEVSTLEAFKENLLQRKAELEAQKEQEVSVKEKLEDLLNGKWAKNQKVLEDGYNKRLSRMKQIVQLELAIIEAIRESIEPEVVAKVEEVYLKVRKSNDLTQTVGMYSQYARDNYKVRKVFKLINAVYRYNRDIISGMVPATTIKSLIKDCVTCPTCGEVAMEVLCRMIDSKAVLLPA